MVEGSVSTAPKGFVKKRLDIEARILPQILERSALLIPFGKTPSPCSSGHGAFWEQRSGICAVLVSPQEVFLFFFYIFLNVSTTFANSRTNFALLAEVS